MDFSKWVKDHRLKSHWDLHEVGEKSGVDNSSITRIETAKTQSTLITAVRLWQAFNIPFADFAKELGILFSLDRFPEIADENSSPYLITADVCNFLKMGLEQESKAKEFVDIWVKRNNNNQERRGMPSPFKNAQSNEFWDLYFRCPYPSDITEKELLLWFTKGEALTFLDAGTYMALLRQNSKLRLIDMEAKTKISDTVLGRIEHGIINKVKLKDLIQVSNLLDKTGAFFALYWMAGIQAAELKKLIVNCSSRRDAQRVWPAEQAAHNLIKFYRWFKTDDLLLTQFVNDLRSRVKKIPVDEHIGK